jgi:nitrogen fixation-related uncharacterized protein
MYLLILLFPNIAYADFDSFLKNVNNEIVNPLIKLLFALAVVYFLWGVFNFFMNSDNADEREKGKMHMLYGIIGITIMMGVWGILNLVLNTLNIDNIDVNSNNENVGFPDVIK